ncbi:MAG: glycosyltransferase family 2 protein [Myxococcota bacterium]
MKANGPALCVAVITRERPDGLERLLNALELQDFDGTFRVVVVDNDPAASARKVCGKPRNFALEYKVEPKPGIPFARNTATASLQDSDDALVTVDDDEVPVPTWLRHLVKTRDRYNADVVAGPVIPSFSGRVPDWAIRGGFFERPRMPTGTVREAVFTGNLLLSRSVVRALEPLFDERMALTGGSDAHLAKRMSLAGFKMVWCDEAVCEETVPESRVSVEWLLKRSFRVGATRAYIEHDLGMGRDRAWVAVRGVTNLLRGSVLLPAYALRGTPGVLHGLRRLAIGAGLLSGSFGVMYDEYSRVHKV